MIARLTFSALLMAAYPPMALGIVSTHSFVRRVHEAEAEYAPLRGLGPNGNNNVRLCASIVPMSFGFSNDTVGFLVAY